MNLNEDDVPQQTPFYDVVSEQAILGGLIADATLVPRVRERLRVDEFYDPLHQKIYSAILKTAEIYPDQLSGFAVYQHLVAESGLEEVGGHGYLSGLVTRAPATNDLRPYIAKLSQVTLRRRLHRFAEELQDTAEETADIEIGDLANDAKQELDQLLATWAPDFPAGNIQSSADFVAGFTPPDYLWDGILQHRFLYALTAATGVGKTAIALRLAAHVALGLPLAGRGVAKGKVLYLAGENPDDLRARWIALSEEMQFDSSTIPVFFYPRIFHIPSRLAELRHMSERLGGFDLVIGDTKAAYFFGDDENANKESGDQARDFRTLTTLTGRPTTLVLAHPTKNAGEGNLTPRGGGAFIAEIDGNLTAVKRPRGAVLHWEGKFRGPDFAPVPFALDGAFSESLRDSRGRLIPTVIARPLSDAELATREEEEDDQARDVLAAMIDKPGASMRELAVALGWLDGKGQPDKSRLQKMIDRMAPQKLVEKEMNKWVPTPRGKALARRIECED